MNNITTTTIRDKISITETESSQIEEFEVSFDSNRKTMDYDKYSVRNVDNYPSIVLFIKNTLSNFELLNEKETITFIVKNIGLIELIEKITPLIKNRGKSTIKWIVIIAHF